MTGEPAPPQDHAPALLPEPTARAELAAERRSEREREIGFETRLLLRMVAILVFIAALAAVRLIAG